VIPVSLWLDNRNRLFVSKLACVVRGGATALLVFAWLFPVKAQVPGAPPGQMGQGIPNQTQLGNSGGGMTDQLVFGTFGHEVMREEDSAYRAFLKEREPAKKIKLGNDFLQRYPKSPLAEQVDVGMMNIYRAQQDWKNTYLWADHALALEPDDVDVLTTIGWTIPHVYTPDDADADQELDKAEKYSKRAIEVLAKMPKPPQMSNEDFVAAKTKRSFQAHSALGLVYFRRDDYENSANELQQATHGNPGQDQTDLFVLGLDLENLKRYDEAAGQFAACGQISGTLAEQCKQNASEMKDLADAPKSSR
jgi:tetratricopeptide (TPR) repeat protein